MHSALIQGVQHTLDGSEVPGQTRADQSPVLFPGDMGKQEREQEMAGAAYGNTARNTV